VPIRLTMTARPTMGFPRRFMVLWENSRCSIQLHLLVRGGKWHPVTVNPARSANCGSPHFRSRTRDPLLPPQSAVTSREVARG
jgi:hypothetical protein